MCSLAVRVWGARLWCSLAESVGARLWCSLAVRVWGARLCQTSGFGAMVSDCYMWIIDTVQLMSQSDLVLLHTLSVQLHVVGVVSLALGQSLVRPLQVLSQCGAETPGDHDPAGGKELTLASGICGPIQSVCAYLWWISLWLAASSSSFIFRLSFSTLSPVRSFCWLRICSTASFSWFSLEKN